MKKNGTYKSSKDLQASMNDESKPKLKKSLSGGLFKLRNSLKSSIKKKDGLAASVDPDAANHRQTVK